MLPLLLTILASPVQAMDCPSGATGTALDAASAIEVAFSTLDDSGFDSATSRLDASLPCADTQLAAGDVVLVHRAMALVAFVNEDDPGSRRSWAAVKALQPAWKPPPSLMPDGHPVRALWDSAEVSPGTVDLPGGPKGGWMLDGKRATEAPGARAFLLQGFGPSGEVVHTAYYREPTGIPTLSSSGEPAEPSGGMPLPRLALAAGGGALLVGSGVMFGLSAKERGLARSPDTPATEIDNHVAAANRHGTTGAVLGGAGALALGLGFAVNW